MAAATQAEEHQVGQEALVSLIPAVLREAWPLLDVHDLSGSMPAFLAAVKAIVARYGAASAAGALDYYRRERLAAGVTSPAPSLRLAPAPADSVIEDAVGWAVSDLYGPVTAESVQAAQDKVAESVSQIVLDQGRDTLIEAVRKDSAAKGWVRVTEQGACSFCIMLALRGEAYRSKRAGEFQAHNNCRCHVEPVFTAHEPSARMREYERMWKDATKGRSGKDARVAFRQAVEGRDVTGTTGPRDAKGAAKASGVAGMSKAQLEHQLALTRGLKDSPWRTQQLARLRKELASRK